jgi:predicted nucleic acid-binding Zn ribbon protein
MATYIYETVPDSPEAPVRRFEIKQSMKDDPLTHDPHTGMKVRRVISGDRGFIAFFCPVRPPRRTAGADC